MCYFLANIYSIHRKFTFRRYHVQQSTRYDFCLQIKETANVNPHRLMRKKHCSVGFSRSQSLLSGSHGDDITLTACRASVPTRSRPVKRGCDASKLSSSSWLAIVVAMCIQVESHKRLSAYRRRRVDCSLYTGNWGSLFHDYSLQDCGEDDSR